MSIFAGKPWLRHYDYWVPPEITFPRQSLYSILQTAASQFRHRPATGFQGAVLTFEEIKRRADALASSLHASGLRKGDRLGIRLPNCPQYTIAFFAAMRLGLIVVNINPVYTAHEIRAVASDSGFRALITLESLVPEELPLDLLLTTSLAAYSLGGQPAGSFDDAIAAGDPATLPPVSIDAEADVALLQYTGGTTGVSKGAMLSHYNLFANVTQNAVWAQLLTRRGEERILMVLPYFHIYGQVAGMLLSAWNGTQTILIPKFDVNLIVAACREWEPTIFPGVPTLYISLLNHPEVAGCGLHKLRNCSAGAAPLPVEIIEQFERMTGVLLREGYGMTETACTSTTTPFYSLRKPGSVGLPVPGTECKIVDIDDPSRELGVNEEGELCVRGPQVMKGYWNNPGETAYALRDGWMLTGDIARMDADGFFYIVQRKKDMIIVSGFKVFPNEVEEALFVHPAVREACVVGTPHPYRGEQVKAFVVPEPGQAPSAAELISHCAGRLAKFKVPSEVEFIDALPKTAVGKVLRRVLRDRNTGRL